MTSHATLGSAMSPSPSAATRVPRDFKYWENLDAPWARALRKRLRRLFHADPLLPDATVRAYAASYYDADPVAEAFIDEVYVTRGQREGRALVDRALAGGVASIPDAPASLVALFRETETAPRWLDLRKVDLGARVFRGFGTHMFSFAGAITLEGYRESSVAKPLAFTGAYTGESAQRRFLETASFWIDVSAPGGLAPGGPGRATALRVRLMHVFVRRRLLAHPAWDLEAWGVPISQGDALLTLMGGSVVPGFALRVLGYRTSREEIDALLHFWRYVGHLMGVQPRWYPETVEDAIGLMFTAQVKATSGSGNDGVELARSYLASYAPQGKEPLAERLRKRVEHGVQRGYVGWFLSPRTRRHFGLPGPGPWRLAVLLQAPWVFARETLRRRIPRFADWADAQAQRSASRWVASHLGERRAEYHAVERMTR